MTIEESSSRNVINPEYINHHCEALCKNLGAEFKHIARWIRSTFRRWAILNAPAKQIVRRSQIDNPVVRSFLAAYVKELNHFFPGTPKAILDAALAGTYTEFEFSSPELEQNYNWLGPMLDADVAVWRINPVTSRANAIHGHWIDYLKTLPERDIRITVADLIPKIAAWDKQLANAKLVGDAAAGTREIKIKKLPKAIMLVELGSEAAFALEGKRMHNCVASYWTRSFHAAVIATGQSELTSDAKKMFKRERKSSLVLNSKWGGLARIYSLRHRETGDPVVTLEVKDLDCEPCLVQAQCVNNTGLGSEHEEWVACVVNHMDLDDLREESEPDEVADEDDDEEECDDDDDEESSDEDDDEEGGDDDGLVVDEGDDDEADDDDGAWDGGEEAKEPPPDLGW